MFIYIINICILFEYNYISYLNTVNIRYSKSETRIIYYLCILFTCARAKMHTKQNFEIRQVYNIDNHNVYTVIKTICMHNMFYSTKQLNNVGCNSHR